VIPFEDDDDAVRIANDGAYGLAGAASYREGGASGGGSTPTSPPVTTSA
jgi:hypothetical protein